jgi:hypothetical protein
VAVRRKWLPLLWGIGLGAAAASYLWGSSEAAGLIIGERILFTLVIPSGCIILCLAISLLTSGRDGEGRG